MRKRFGLFSGGAKREEVVRTLNASLEATHDGATQPLEPVFWEQLDWLLESEDPTLCSWTLSWMSERLKEGKDQLPEVMHIRMIQRIGHLKCPSAIPYMLDCLTPPPADYKRKLPMLLASLAAKHDSERLTVIDQLFRRYLDLKSYHWMHKPLLRALKQLDTIEGEVTDLVLHQFPSLNIDQNMLMIHLLGQSGKYRVVKPLIAFANETPHYLRPVAKALSHFEFDEVNQFYLDCLQKSHLTETPIILLEALKQVRRRRLKKAIEALETLFPLDEAQFPLISRKINGEIALTMASFGNYMWARDQLLPEVMLSGVTVSYLKSIDMLGLQEAVPLLKAILLLPETPATTHIQERSFEICQRLLSMR